MKSAIVLSVLATLMCSAYAINSKDLAEVIEKCQTETGFKGTPKDIKREGASKDEKCFLLCLSEKKEMMNKDGTINMEGVKAATALDKTIPDDLKDKFNIALEECSKEVKPDTSDMCETAYKYFTCKQGKMAPKKD